MTRSGLRERCPQLCLPPGERLGVFVTNWATGLHTSFASHLPSAMVAAIPREEMCHLPHLGDRRLPRFRVQSEGPIARHNRRPPL